MATSIRQSRSAALWSLVARQHGVVSRTQLLGLGFTPGAIKHRIARGRLHVIWRGVYAVGRPELTRHGRWMAAVLACRAGAVLSHRSAAELWELLPPRDGAIDVSVAGGSARRLRGIRVHRRRTLGNADVAAHHGIPVTTAICTLVDIASDLSAAEVETAINEGDKRDRFDPDELRDAIDASPGRPGVGVLRRILDRATFSLTDSELERRFLPISRGAGLPRPRTQAVVAGFRVDFFYEELGLVVETDGLRYHRTPTQQARDRLRDQTHASAGLTTLRFTHAQVRYEPAHVQRVLRLVHARLMNRGSDSDPDSTTAATSAGSSGPRRPRAGSGGRPWR